MKHVYELDVYKLATGLSEMVSHDFGNLQKIINSARVWRQISQFPISNF